MDTMRIVARYPSRSEAEERAAFLRAHGIVPHVSNTTSLLRSMGLRKDRSQAALWVLLDAQHDDAVALLDNPDHQPASAMDADTMAAMESEGSLAAQRLLFKGVMLLAGGLIALFALLFMAGVL